MNRTETEQNYWNEAALDPDVDTKYICDLPVDACKRELGKMNGKVLEIGCGVGRLLEDGWYGVDISKEMLNIAKHRRPSCTYKLTTGNLPFDDAQFDNVYSMLVFQHIKAPTIKKYMREAHRVLKTGGRFMFQFIPGDEQEPFSNHYDAKDMDQWLCKAGFTKIIWSDSKIHPQWMWMEATK